jgi:hypothetical protein
MCKMQNCFRCFTQWAIVQLILLLMPEDVSTDVDVVWKLETLVKICKEIQNISIHFMFYTIRQCFYHTVLNINFIDALL